MNQVQLKTTTPKGYERPKYFYVGLVLQVIGENWASSFPVKVVEYSPVTSKTVLCSSMSNPNLKLTIDKSELWAQADILWTDVKNEAAPLEKEMAELLLTPDIHTTVVSKALSVIPPEVRGLFLETNGQKWSMLTPLKLLGTTDKVPMLIAHTDLSAGVKTPTLGNLKFSKDKVFSSSTGLGADDRAGVFALSQLMKLVEDSAIYLFTDDEEVGCLGAKEFSDSTVSGSTGLQSVKANVSCFISVDRRREYNGDATVATYGYSSKELEAIILEHTKRKAVRGSTTDCRTLSNKTGVDGLELTEGIACVNFSCGYQSEHTVNEKLYFKELIDTVEDIEGLIRSKLIVGKQFTYSNPVVQSYSCQNKTYKSGAYNYKKGTYSFPDFEDSLDDTIEVDKVKYTTEDVEKLLSFYSLNYGTSFTSATKLVKLNPYDNVRLKDNIVAFGVYGGYKILPAHLDALSHEEFSISEVDRKSSKVCLEGLTTGTSISDVPMVILKKISKSPITIVQDPIVY